MKMADVAKRKLEEDQDESDLSSSKELPGNSDVLTGNESDSACEEDLFDDSASTPEPIIPQKVLDLADHALAKLPPRWRNWMTRVISGLSLISGFSALVSMGPSGLFFLTFLVVSSSYAEVLKMGLGLCGVKEAYMHKWAWCLFLVFHWIVISGDLQQNLEAFPVLEALLKYKIALGFSLYLGLVVYFVLKMEETQYMRRYALFAWCHVWLLCFVFPCHLLNKATMSGLIWYVMPMSIITINDIAAYMVGFFVGKTPLIKLSPKKTKEGFIGGGLITLLVGTLFTYCLMTPYLVCPVQFNPDYVADLISQLRPPSRPLFQVSACQVSPVFRPRPLQFGSFSFHYYPFVLHGFFVSLFFKPTRAFWWLPSFRPQKGLQAKEFWKFDSRTWWSFGPL